MISTVNLRLLPAVKRLRKLLQSLAMLDAILCPEWQYRYYSFNAHWSKGEQLGSMRDGCGDDFFALFNTAGCFLKGFAHESPMSPYGQHPKRLWPGILEDVPAEFASCLQEPAFVIEDTTFCIWRMHSGKCWRRGDIDFPSSSDPDGSGSLLSILDCDAASYKAWAEDHYEQPVSLRDIRWLYEHKPMTERLVHRFNPERTLENLAEDIREIGYPDTIVP